MVAFNITWNEPAAQDILFSNMQDSFKNKLMLKSPRI